MRAIKANPQGLDAGNWQQRAKKNAALISREARRLWWSVWPKDGGGSGDRDPDVAQIDTTDRVGTGDRLGKFFSARDESYSLCTHSRRHALQLKRRVW